MLKRVSIIFLVCILCFGAFAGCAKKDDPAPKEPSENQGETEQPKQVETKEIEFWTISLSPTFDDYINGFIADFESKNEGAKVKWLDVPFDQIEKKTLTAATTNSLPDVMNLNVDWLNKLAELKVVVNMDEALTAEEKGRYFKTVWDANGYRGQVYGIPWYLSTSVLNYNKEIYKQAGLDPEKPAKTIDELIEHAYIIKEKTGKYTDIDTISQLFPKMNTPMLNEDWTEGRFNTPEGLETLKLYKKLFDDEIISREVVLKTKDPRDLYNAGESATWMTGPQLLRNTKENAPDIYEVTGVAANPEGRNGLVHVAIMNLAVAESSKHKDLAIDFALHVASHEQMLEFCKLVPILPSTKKTVEDPFFAQLPDNPEPMDIGKLISAQQLDKGSNLGLTCKNAEKIRKEMQDTVVKVLLDEITPEKGLEELDKKVTELLK